MMAAMPDVKFEDFFARRLVHSIRHQEDGTVFLPGDRSRPPHAARGAPTRASRSSPASNRFGWTLPIDDTSFRIYVAARVKIGDIGRMRSKFNGKVSGGT